uniref:Uncharacterized protein n=1 Tax=Timema douglasi TaxID=61478 RepID=A0A7R8Z4V1_TIMDO|nr:unnamed protein product [Timema douglasi]
MITSDPCIQRFIYSMAAREDMILQCVQFLPLEELNRPLGDELPISDLEDSDNDGGDADFVLSDHQSDSEQSEVSDSESTDEDGESVPRDVYRGKGERSFGVLNKPPTSISNRFSTKESATHAIVAVHNTDINGQTVKCSWGKESGDPNNAQAAGQQWPNTLQLPGNLSYLHHNATYNYLSEESDGGKHQLFKHSEEQVCHACSLIGTVFGSVAMERVVCCDWPTGVTPHRAANED